MTGLHRLNSQKIKNTNKRAMLSDGGNLYLNVNSATAKSWVFMWSKGNQRRQFGLGSYRDVSLKAAREMAAKARQALAQGKDPKKAIWPTPDKTFREVALACVESRAVNWKQSGKTGTKWMRSINHYCGHLLSRPICSINREDIFDLLEPVWSETPETGRILRGHLEVIFNYAKGRGWYSGENPANWKGGLEAVLPSISQKSVKHHSALNFEDIPEFVSELREREAIAARALEFCILTATRTSESLHATFSEFDLDTKVWTLSPERTKTGVEHKVPLSPRAIEIVREMQSHAVSDFLFPGQKPGKPLSNMAMLKLLQERMGRPDLTVHGFRSTFRDWAGDVTEYPRDIVEQCLSHTVGDKVERAYRRRTGLERRARVMDAWAEWCEGKQKNGEVVRLYG